MKWEKQIPYFKTELKLYSWNRIRKTDNMEIGHLDIGEWGVLGVIKKS